jgi:hypothetical protein
VPVPGFRFAFDAINFDLRFGMFGWFGVLLTGIRYCNKEAIWYKEAKEQLCCKP